MDYLYGLVRSLVADEQLVRLIEEGKRVEDPTVDDPDEVGDQKDPKNH